MAQTITQGIHADERRGKREPGLRGHDQAPLLNRLLPFLTALAEQIIAYVRHCAEKRDAAVALWAVFFLAMAIGPALLLDLIRLPAKCHEVWLDQKAKARAASVRRRSPNDM